MPKDFGSLEQAAWTISKPRARIAHMQKFALFLRKWPLLQREDALIRQPTDAAAHLSKASGLGAMGFPSELASCP
jgi:hypothetical protein